MASTIVTGLQNLLPSCPSCGLEKVGSGQVVAGTVLGLTSHQAASAWCPVSVWHPSPVFPSPPGLSSVVSI